MLFQTPVDPVRRKWSSFKQSAALLWRERRIGDQAYRLVDLLTQSANDYLSAWFESDIIKSVLAYYASIGTFAGPKSPGSAYVIARILHAIVVAIILVVICAAFGRFFYSADVPSGATLAKFAVMLIVGAASFAALGLAITAVIPNAGALGRLQLVS